jgi:O-antigen/teichoic acid export membrane protein
MACGKKPPQCANLANGSCNMLAELGTNAGLPAVAGPANRLAGLARKVLPTGMLAASRGGAILAQFAAQLAVGTLAGASGLGVLQLFTSWTCIAGEVLGLGLPTRAMRQVSVAYAAGQPDQIEQILRESRRRILRVWLWLLLLVAVPAAVLLRLQAAPDWTDYRWLLLAAGLVAPLFSLLRLYAESTKASGAALAAVTLESLTSPVLLLLACASCWLAGAPLASITLVTAFGLSLVITPLALRARLRQRLAQLPQVKLAAGAAAANPPAPRGDLLYLWGTSVLSIGFLQLPFVVMPLYVDTAEIGVFAVAHKLINVVTTLLLLLAAVFGPAFARSAAQRDHPALLGLLRRTQLISTAVFLPAALVLLALAGPIAELFGNDFGDLRLFLAILAAGHLVNAATGLSGVLLNMAGAASRELATLVIALAAALAGSAWVGPEYGAPGLAAVFSGSIALKNLASYALATHFLKPTSTQQ